MAESMLIVRLGAMGDILHALPSAASLKRSFPGRRLIWVARTKWAPLFEGNPYIDEVLPFERGSVAGVVRSWASLRRIEPVLAFDLQGLVQSALVGRATRPRRFWGFSRKMARESLAAAFYTHSASPPGPHRLQRNLQLVQAAGAADLTDETWVPQGQPEGSLPEVPFVLASPFAGWGAKQWPLSSYAALARQLQQMHVPLVLNVAPAQARLVAPLPNIHVHLSSLRGLIDATRRAVAVIGVDSGPLHLAAALRKPGIAIFGPTDPFTHGPYGGSMTVLRSAGAETTYKRLNAPQQSMLAISIQDVMQPLRQVLEQQTAGAAIRR